MNDRIDAYAKFITNQLIKEGAVSSSNDKNATQYERHKKLAMRSPDLKMAGVDGYFHKDNNMFLILSLMMVITTKNIMRWLHVEITLI